MTWPAIAGQNTWYGSGGLGPAPTPTLPAPAPHPPSRLFERREPSAETVGPPDPLPAENPQLLLYAVRDPGCCPRCSSRSQRLRLVVLSPALAMAGSRLGTCCCARCRRPAPTTERDSAGAKPVRTVGGSVASFLPAAIATWTSQSSRHIINESVWPKTSVSRMPSISAWLNFRGLHVLVMTGERARPQRRESGLIRGNLAAASRLVGRSS